MEPSDLRLLRRLLTSERVLSLGLLVEGAPLVGVLPFLATPDLDALIVHASRLARHTQGLRPGVRYGAAIHAPDSPGGDPLRLPRVIVEGAVDLLPGEELEAARERWLARFASAALTLPLSDFVFFRLALESGRLVADFGRAFSLDGAAFRAAARTRD
jgi:hypothetical protein